MVVDIDRTDICNMLSGVEPSYEEMDGLERIGLGYYVGGFNDEWHWDKNRFKDFSDEELLQIYMQIVRKWTSRLDGTGTLALK